MRQSGLNHHLLGCRSATNGTMLGEIALGLVRESPETLVLSSGTGEKRG